jgi:hypothetical protein
MGGYTGGGSFTTRGLGRATPADEGVWLRPEATRAKTIKNVISRFMDASIGSVAYWRTANSTENQMRRCH